VAILDTSSLEEMKKALGRLQKAHTWQRISLVLFNRSDSYAAKVYHGQFVPSGEALDFYLRWKSLNEGTREQASGKLCAAVWDYIEKHPASSKYMADYFLIDRRKIRKAVAVLVLDGFPIASGPQGYEEIASPETKRAALDYLWAKEKAIRKRRIALSRLRLVDQRSKAVVVANGVSQFQLPDPDLIEAP